jgi:cytochrome c
VETGIMTTKTVTLPLDLTEQEAWDFAQFLKRAGYSDYANKAADEDEAYRMLHVGEKVRGALAEAGISPR